MRQKGNSLPRCSLPIRAALSVRLRLFNWRDIYAGTEGKGKIHSFHALRIIFSSQNQSSANIGTKMIKSLYLQVVNYDRESRKLLEMIGRQVKQDARILDIGCGYGRNMDRLSEGGFQNVTGIDINPEIVEANKARGLKCIGVGDLNDGIGKFDLMLMSHVVEHFSPFDLKNFIDGYLEFLVPNGFLVIATPLMSEYFYDDFDHVKPYQPSGIMQVFGTNKAQIQYYAKNKLVLRDIWFRTGYHRFGFFRANYVKSAYRKLLQAAVFCSAFLFFISAGLIGKKDGWVGVFQKVSVE